MTNAIKTLVSKKKKRFIEDGFNLDLTYIIPGRIIAMGYPSENVESIYRNSMEDVRRLLEEKHKDHYKIYNLCSERSYNIEKFHNRVSVYPFDDHNPPEFGQMRPFCEDVAKWLEEHEKNVAVVHCKAGKGRTGLMICAYLLHSRVKSTAQEVLEYYASIRTSDSKGVTIPSQRRYVDYYATMISDTLQYNPVKMYLTSIVIDPLPQLGRGQQEGFIQFEVRQTSVRPFVSDVYAVRRTDGRINIELPQPLLIVGDIKIEFIGKIKLLDIFNVSQRPRYVNSNKLFHFWVNTFFIDQQRTSSLTHSSTLTAPGGPALQPAPATPPVSIGGAGPGWPPPASAEDRERNCRSTHNSGGTDSPLPNPRVLRHTLSSGDSRTSDPASQGSSEDQSEDHSPNGTNFASAQTITGPPAKTVSIVGHYSQVGPNDPNCDSGGEGLKHMSSSDDSIIRPGADTAAMAGAERGDSSGPESGSGSGPAVCPSSGSTTHTSFILKRQRHSSVPQTARTQGPTVLTKSKRNIEGRFMSVRLNKNQIDKASKDKSGKFNDNFNVTLFLVRPNDQTLQAEFSRSNILCQRGLGGSGGGGGAGCEVGSKHESSEDSSEDEAAELRRRHLTPGTQDQPDTASHHSYTEGRTVISTTADRSQLPAVRTLSAHLPALTVGVAPCGGSGLVRTSTEPQQRLSEMTLSQSTWI